MDHLIKKMKKHPDYHKAGMILCHNGIVRRANRDGRKVESLVVKAEHHKLKKIVENHKKDKGIIEILIEIEEDKTLFIGDDIMRLVVAGDIRENVISTLTETLNEVKTTAVDKVINYV